MVPDCRPLCGRLAPSPTGALHLGNARSFLLAWLSLRSRGGKVILRLEDLDHPKVKPETAREAYADLRWLGLDWDEGPDCGGPHAPYVQSQRCDHYRTSLDRLRQKDLVYPCTCSRRDVMAAQSAPHAEDEGPRYPGTCAGRYASYASAAETLPPDRQPAWRFRAPDRPVSFVDGFAGPCSANVQARDGDFAFARSPEGAGYQLAVVVDDAAMGVSEVLRGDDLLPSSYRQLLLYEALELTPPAFIHVPLVVGDDGRRLAKRHGDTRLSALRRAGVPPERIVGWLGNTCGWAAPGEALHPSALLERFDLAALPASPAVVDTTTLARLLS